MTAIHCVLEDTAATSKHQAALRQGDKIILYSEWNDLASAVADRLRACGVAAGDRVGLFMGNDWRMLVLITGIVRAGAVACPISTRLPRAAVIEQLGMLGARHVIAYLDASKGTDLGGPVVLSPDDLLMTPERASAGGYRMALDAPAVIIFTSGSSGVPKPAVLTYGNLYYNARGANANIRLASNDSWLLNLPMYHVSGLGVMMRCLLAGACVVIPESGEAMSAALLRCRPTHVSLVPSQLASLLDDTAGQPFPFLKCILLGGAACDPECVREARGRKWPVYVTYGMTEMASQIATMPPGAPPVKQSDTVGKVLRHREVKMSGADEICVRGPCLFAGYWSEGRVISATEADGWFRTGDRGAFDGDGYLRVFGRKDFLIISGGENIQPEEIEFHLRSLDGVEDVVVVGVSDPDFGQRPVAFVKAEQMMAEAWAADLSARLPKFKVPDAFYAWPDEIAAGGGDIKISRAWFAERAKSQRGGK